LSDLENLAGFSTAKLYLSTEEQFIYTVRCTIWANFR